MRKTVCSVSYDGDVFIRPDPIKHAPSDLNQLRLNRLGRKKKIFFFERFTNFTRRYLR